MATIDVVFIYGNSISEIFLVLNSILLVRNSDSYTTTHQTYNLILWLKDRVVQRQLDEN